jgi:hypothetical protein
VKIWDAAIEEIRTVRGKNELIFEASPVALTPGVFGARRDYSGR